MPVAKTYEKMVIEGEPFRENGKLYVNVKSSKGSKKVRWYSEAEYARMYPATAVKKDLMDFNGRYAFGFGDEGFITLYKGKNVEEWAENDRHNIYYNLTFLYYTPGRLTLPQLAEGIEPIQLKWEDVMDHDDRMKSHEEVKKIVANLLYEESHSQYQGEINAWLQKEVTVEEKKSDESRFGLKHTYTLNDAEGNTYIWQTGAKDYARGTTVLLKMKVKEHKEIENKKVTVVWYCKEV